MKKYPNNVVEVYKGVKIRRWNKIAFHVHMNAFKELIDLTEKFDGMSIPKILAHSSQPCDKCKGLEIVVFSEDGTKSYKIKRGLLKVPHQSSGGNIKQFNAKISTACASDDHNAGQKLATGT